MQNKRVTSETEFKVKVIKEALLLNRGIDEVEDTLKDQNIKLDDVYLFLKAHREDFKDINFKQIC